MMSPSCRNLRLLTACRSTEVGATLPLMLIPDAKGKDVLLVLLSDPGSGRTIYSSAIVPIASSARIAKLFIQI